MTSGNAEIVVRKATKEDLDAIKGLADAHRQELGFVRRPTLLEAIKCEEVIVAQNCGHLAGFVHYHHRHDEQTTLYDIVVSSAYRRQGIGRSLVKTLVAEAAALGKQVIVLRCPEELLANSFYAHIGFEHWKGEPGKRRKLVVWRLVFQPQGTTVVVRL